VRIKTRERSRVEGYYGYFGLASHMKIFSPGLKIKNSYDLGISKMRIAGNFNRFDGQVIGAQAGFPNNKNNAYNDKSKYCLLNFFSHWIFNNYMQ